jgi:CPA2 family monovalent cation:H+ antiporter-2
MTEDHFLTHVVLFLFAAVFVVAIFKKLNLSPVLGYFAAGAVIGEHGLKLVSNNTGVVPEIGVVFLLFAIGLELTFDRLKAMRLHVFGFGSLQVILTSLALGSAVLFLCHQHLNASLIIGGGLALSSTAIVMQVVAEHRRQSTQVGRLSLAILLMQDFAVVPLLVLVPLLASEQANIGYAMSMALLKALAALVGIFIIGRLGLRPLFQAISTANTAKSNELFVATTLLIALGSALATEMMGLSLALGAFVAGLLVAETEFHIQAEESITPFKGLLLGLFFMTVGMTIDLQLILTHLQLVAIYSASLIAIKATIIISLCLLFRFSVGASIHAGLLLAQGSEFAFILFELAGKQGLINENLAQILLLVVTITMALTPLMSVFGHWVAAKLDKKDKMPPSEIFKEIADLENHVIIAGFGRVGKMVARLLEAENINYIATDVSAEIIAEGRKDGFPVYLGDSSRIEDLMAMGAARAKSVIISIDNEITMKKATTLLRKKFPKLSIIVRAKDLSNAQALYQYGASTIVPETYETGLQLGGAVLKAVGISEYEVSRIKNQFRAGNYILASDEEDIEDDETQVSEDGGEYCIINVKEDEKEETVVLTK